MRLPRVRLRTLMIAVAVAGLILVGLREFASGIALANRRLAQKTRAQALEFRRRATLADPTRARHLDAQAKRLESRAAQFERAARRPWLPVPPDPPAPE